MTSTIFFRMPQTGSFHSKFLTVLEAATGLGTVVLPLACRCVAACCVYLVCVRPDRF